MTLVSVASPQMVLDSLYQGRPLEDPGAMAVLSLDRPFLQQLTQAMGDLGDARGHFRGVWLFGDRGCGKTQLMLALDQMITATYPLDRINRALRRGKSQAAEFRPSIRPDS